MTAVSGSLPIRVEQDGVLARQAARQAAVACRMRLIDQTKLVTAASELARNAVIYGGGGSMEWEVVDSGMRRGLRLVFSDNGPGIAPDVMAALFTPFTTTKPHGLGLGLVISRDIAADFGGELQAHSEPGAGTRFTLLLQQARPS